MVEAKTEVDMVHGHTDEAGGRGGGGLDMVKMEVIEGMVAG